MNDKNFRVEDYLAGKATLPATFDTGYRHHLETAREIIRRRKGIVATGPATQRPREDRGETLATA